ncbi:MAG TPA: hypothetical protein VFM18_11865 [Methanosarcina sp.]|nr:hypothetical protein [Methanosarcina sp.]
MPFITTGNAVAVSVTGNITVKSNTAIQLWGYDSFMVDSLSNSTGPTLVAINTNPQGSTIDTIVIQPGQSKIITSDEPATGPTTGYIVAWQNTDATVGNIFVSTGRHF